MRTLIIGDIHNEFKRAEVAIQQIPHDKVVFVGDYFDSLNDGRKKAGKTATWLKESLKQPNRIHLFGNHDVPYFKQVFSCPGYDNRKSQKVNYVLQKEDWLKLKFHTWVDQFLVTHAGLHPIYHQDVGNLSELKEWLEKEEAGAFDVIENGNGKIGWGSKWKHWFWDRSLSSGGTDTSAGILWQRWNEDFATGFWDHFPPKCVVNQIVGHTPDSHSPIRLKYWKGSKNYCVDGMWGACMVVEDGREEFWRNNWEAYRNNPYHDTNKKGIHLIFTKIEEGGEL